MTLRSSFRLIALAALLLVCAPTGYGQTAQVTGRITDANAAVTPGVEVKVTNVETGIARRAVSNDEGYYTVPLLPRGVTASKQSFKPLTRTGVTLDEGQTLRLDFALEVGDLVESVEVTGAPLLESATTTVSTVIPNEKILDLPLVNRNIMTLAALAPAVRPVGDFGSPPVSSFGGARMSIAGGPLSANNFQIDGVAAENFTSGSPNIFLSVDATEEFCIVTRNPSAEHGRTGGGVISVVSKSGTNEFHGSAYEFHRNRALNANDFFFNRTARRSPSCATASR